MMMKASALLFVLSLAPGIPAVFSEIRGWQGKPTWYQGVTGNLFYVIFL